MSQRGRNDKTKVMQKTKAFGSLSSAITSSPTRAGTQTSFKRYSSVENDPRTNMPCATRQPGPNKLNTTDGPSSLYGPARTHQTIGAFSCLQKSNKSPKTKPAVSSPSLMEVELSASKQNTSGNRSNLVRASAVHSPLLNCAYEAEISQFLHGQQRPSPLIEWSALSITPRMRMVLIDWLIEVAEEYHLQDQTLFLAVSYLEHCLAKPVSVHRDTLQLLGITCLFIAAKLEEVYPPPLSEFAFITDHTYKTEQILNQENIILEALSFNLTHITVQDILQIVLAQQGIVTEEPRYFAMYLAQLIAPSPDLFRNYLPSELATSIAMLTAYTFNNAYPLREQVNSYVSPYPCRSTPESFRACLTAVFTFCSSLPKSLVAAKEKYSKTSYCKISVTRQLPASLPL